MGPRDFERVEELYRAALARPPGERDAFLEDACGGDVDLLHEVKSLLGYEEEAKRLLEEPVVEAATQRLAVLRGTRLGPYEVLDLIGAGGMGEVYRARDTRLGREVAIKVLHEAAAGDTDQLERFEREARAAAALNHPNIATIYEIGDHEGTRFISMELVEGRTLKERLKEGPLPLEELLDLATQIARGLAKAHGAGIVHRDLKPGNLMVTSEGLVKILDFGLAKRTPHATDVQSGITREGSVLGTVQYMSPEQAAARPLDHRSDQFSFGAILYEMATGRRAFERDTAPQTLAAIIEDTPEPMKRLNAEIPVELSAIVERCLAKNAHERYDSTADLVKALALASAAASAPLRRPRRWRTVAGLALVAAVAAFVVSRYASRPEAPEPQDIPLEAVPFTTYPGREAEPTFSPDGSHVAFTWDGEGQDDPDVYVKAIGSEQPLRLTSDPARDGSPAWSPDGTQIAFLRDKPWWGLGAPPHPSHRRTRAAARGGAGPGSPGALVVSRRPLPGRRGSILAWRSPRDLRAGRGERREDATHLAFLHLRHPAGFLAGRSNRRLQPEPPRPWSFRARRSRGRGRAERARANPLPEGSTGLDSRREGDPLRRGACRRRRRSTEAIVGGKGRRLVVESACRRRAGPPPGWERGRRGRGRVGGRTSARVFAGDDRLGHLAARSPAAGISGRSADPVHLVHQGSTRIPSFPPMASEWRSLRFGAASPRSGSSTGKAGTLSA